LALSSSSELESQESESDESEARLLFCVSFKWKDTAGVCLVWALFRSIGEESNGKAIVADAICWRSSSKSMVLLRGAALQMSDAISEILQT